MILRRMRSHLTYANVVSTICLLAVAGPSIAWAAASLGGRDIKDNSLTSRDVRNGSLGAIDLNPSTRRSFTDTSPWETIPSGQLVTGAFNYGYVVHAGNDLHIEPIQLPARPPRAFATEDVNFSEDGNASTIDSDPSCTGSFAAPTAPAGKVCFYLGAQYAVTNIQAVGGEYAHMRAKGLFNLMWNDAPGVPPGESNELFGSWAYRAP